MFLALFVLLFSGIIWSAEGTFDFTQTPGGRVYFMEGSNAVFEWKYSVSNKAAEFKYVIWKVILNSGAVTLLYENENGDVINGSKIPAAYVGRVQKEGQATLVVKNITFNDSVYFQCVLRQKSGALNDHAVELVVTGKAAVHPLSRIAVVGGSVSFTCNATAVPSKNFTFWRGQGETKLKLVHNGQNVTIDSGSGSSELVLSNIRDGAGGFYTCDATANINQPNTALFYLQLPEFDCSCITKDYSTSISRNLTIDCPVSGFPPPIVTWKKNGILLQKELSTKLTITSVEEDDFGIYTCTATNFESSPCSCNVSVVKERAEMSLKCSNGTPQQPAKLEWSPLVGSKYYVLKIAGDDVHDDLVIGAKTSLEIHYHALVMKKADEKPEETEMSVYLSAMDDERVLAKAACEKLTLKRPNDVEH